jgi:RNA polymerase sigma factor (TIGR02999 family)
MALMSEDITLVLQAIGRGEKLTSEALLPLVYEELRRLAKARMARESAGQTLQATALVHEAWVRLVEHGSRTWENRGHFFAAASEAMRRILIENARRKASSKHGGGRDRVDLSEMELAETTPDEKMLLINEALEQLEREYPERARIVVLKYFGGLTNKEVAETLDIGERSVDRHWLCARNWLFRKLQSQA